MKEKNLLIIAQGFPDKDNVNYDGTFIKEQIKFLRNKFDNVYVIVPTPYTPSFIKSIPFFPKAWRDFCRRKNYNYDNIDVYFPRFFFPPFNLGKEPIEKLMSRVVEETILKNNISFDIIHAHFSYPAGYVGAVIKKTYNKPLVVTVHEGDEWFRNEIGNEKCLYAWKSADVIIRVSERDMYLFGKSGISMDKVNYIPNGFDHTLFKRIKKDKARKILGLPLNKKILLTIGKLEERKNQKMVIEAVKSLRKNHKDIQYLILGEGPERPELESIIKTDQLEEYVILVGGNKKRSEIPLWIFASDIFVLPSLSEGNPTVMFEALGCHVPYIGSDVGGSSSIIKNDKVGMLFKSGDISDLINKLDIALSKKWDKEIIRKYSEQFSWKRISEQIYSLYIKIMK